MTHTERISQIKVIQHENTLLRQRNRVLSEENAQLLAQLEQKEDIIRTMPADGYSLLKRENEEARRIIEERIPDLIQSLQALPLEDDCISVSLSILSSKSKPETSATHLDLLIDICKGLVEKINASQIRSKSDRLKEIQEKLRIRQEHRKSNSQLESKVHFVKDPSNEITSLVLGGGRIPQQDLSYIKKFYETLIFRLLDDTQQAPLELRTSKRNLQTLFDLFTLTIDERWKVKSAQANLVLVERQYQMGNLGQCVINEAISVLESSRKRLRIDKGKLDQLYNQLLVQ